MEKEKTIDSARFEPGTFRVLGGCDNHYTTESHDKRSRLQRIKGPALSGKGEKKLIPPGFEPGTFRVLGGCDNHYTTESHDMRSRLQRIKGPALSGKGGKN